MYLQTTPTITGLTFAICPIMGMQACHQGKEEFIDAVPWLLPKEVAVLQQLSDVDGWNRSLRYGHRWIAESVFSAIKRMFGEYVMARKYANMAKEMLLKVSLYSMFVNMKL